MKVGVLLPTFRDNARDALAAARRSEDLGVDGVFAYDHLWPMGSPTRPSLAPFAVLAAVAHRHRALSVGPLVARVGMVGRDHLITQFRSLHELAPGRVIAAVGTGDAKSRDELEAYGLNFARAKVRRTLVDQVCSSISGEMEVWIGAGAEATNQLARRHGVPLNVWDADIDLVRRHAGEGPVTWAGPPRDDLEHWLDLLELAGAQWAVLAPDVDVERLANWRHAH